MAGYTIRHVGRLHVGEIQPPSPWHHILAHYHRGDERLGVLDARGTATHTHAHTHTHRREEQPFLFRDYIYRSVCTSFK